MIEPEDERTVCCIGGMTVDRVLTLQMPGNTGTSNPVTSRHRCGGVARNVAEHLAQLGVPCKLIAVVGDDPDGRDVVLETAQQGVDTGLVQKSLSRPTGSCTSVVERDGELFAGFADMGICDGMDRGFIQNRWIQIRKSSLVFTDTTLPADSLAWLIAGCRQHGLVLVVDAVSTANARKLPLNLHGVEMLICDLDEARAILGDELPKDAESMATALCQRGAASTAVVAGEDGLSFANADGCVALPAEGAARVDVRRDGDAFIAATLYGRFRGYDAVDSLRIGLKAAHLVADAGPDASRLSAEALTAGL